jgi:hypothetical protein
MNNYIRLEIGKPQTVALKLTTGVKVTGYHGPELRWMLADGRALYTPLTFAETIQKLNLKPGERFQVERRKDGLHVHRISDLRGGQKAALLVEKAPDLDGPYQTPSEPPRKPMETALERALKTAVSACAQAEMHGKQIGYAVRFTPSDVRALGITLLIGEQQKGRAA